MTEALVKHEDVDYLSRYAAEASSKLWVGSLVKFSKGEYLVGENEIKVALGSKFVAMVPSLMSGWLKWSDGHVVDNAMGLVDEGFVTPKREDLGDMVKEQWEQDGNGRPKDPWAKANYLILISPEDKQVFTFACGSKGGFSAIGELARAFSQHRRMYPSQMPVIELGASSYRHPEFGKVAIPVLKIVEWTESEPFMAVLEAGKSGAAEEAEPKAKRVASKPKAVPPAKKKKGGGKGHGIRF
jgi:hypothetical protein